MTDTARHPSTADSSLKQHWAAFDLTRLSAGKGSELVYNRITGAMSVLTPDKLKMLDGCRTFETLDRHSRSICLELHLGPLHLKAIRQQLDEFVSNGLLTSSDQLSNGLSAGADVDAPPLISAVGIPTCNRSDSLDTCLRSFARCAKEYDRQIQFFVADQSDEQSQRDANLHVLAEVKKRYGCDIYYGGLEEKHELARTLATKTGHPFELVNFAVSNGFGCSTPYGANRNALLLSTVGRLCIQTDDDTECLLVPPPKESEQLSLTSTYSPLHMRFLSKSEFEQLGMRGTTGDVFAVHEQLLGKTLSSCLEERPAVKIDRAKSTFFQRANPRRVLATPLGSAGEAAIGTSFFFLVQEDNDRSDLLRSEEVFRYAMESHGVLRFASNPTISEGTFCCGMNMGLDNRHLLPPFSPVGRNEDGVFGELMNKSSVGYFGFLPAMILHKRPPRQSTSDDLRQFASTMQLGDVFWQLLQGLKFIKELDPANNLIAVGQALARLGSAKEATFDEILRWTMVSRASRMIHTMEHRLSKYSYTPQFWVSELEMCLSAVQEAMADERYFIASDLSDRFADDDARRLTQRLVERFGELLQIWPDLVQAAKDLSDQGWAPFRSL